MKLRVGSYNVHGFVGADGRRDPDRVFEVLREMAVDVAGLQEVVFPGKDEPLSSPVLGPMHVVSAPLPTPDGRFFGNAVISRFPVREYKTIVLDYGEREPRTALEVTIELQRCPLRVVATHLGLLPIERRFQVQVLLNHMAGEDDVPTLLLGDFNEWFLFGRPLRWLEARFGRGPFGRTFPARAPLFALDRIWVHPKDALTGFFVHRSPLAREASDHLPVYVDLQL